MQSRRPNAIRELAVMAKDEGDDDVRQSLYIQRESVASCLGVPSCLLLLPLLRLISFVLLSHRDANGNLGVSSSARSSLYHPAACDLKTHLLRPRLTDIGLPRSHENCLNTAKAKAEATWHGRPSRLAEVVVGEDGWEEVWPARMVCSHDTLACWARMFGRCCPTMWLVHKARALSPSPTLCI